MNEEQYYTYQQGKTEGPFTVDILRVMAASGAIGSETYVAMDGWERWVPLSEIMSARAGDERLPETRLSLLREDSDYVAFIKEKAAEILRGKLNESTATMYLGQFLEVIEYEPAVEDIDTIYDLSSYEMCELIIRTVVQAARGYRQYMSGLDPHVMGPYPAWRIIVGRPAVVARNWPERWTLSCQAADDAKALDVYRKTGQMVALKSSRVWTQLGNPALWPDALGNPWPPFFFNSGKVTRDVTSNDAGKLGFEIPKRKTIETKPFQASGGVSSKLPPDVAKAVRANLESQGFTFNRDGSINEPPEARRTYNSDVELFNRIEEAPIQEGMPHLALRIRAIASSLTPSSENMHSK